MTPIPSPVRFVAGAHRRAAPWRGAVARRRVFAASTIACLLSGATRARAAEPLDLVPADSLICWFGLPLPDARPPDDPPTALGALLDVGARLAGGPIDSKGLLILRGLEALGTMVRYPYALALLDARARPQEGSPRARKLDQLKLALVVRTAGRPDPFLRIIQKMVNEQTGADFATIANRRAGPWSYQQLADSRLPDWCIIAWGEIDEHFVITLGEEVWPAVAATAQAERPSLARDEWVRAVRRAGGGALVEILAPPKAICERLDPFVDGRASDFFEAWESREVERTHWALGFEGRALFCRLHYRIAGETRERLLADPRVRDERVLALVPPEARYAVYDLPLASFFPQVVTSLYSIRGREYRETSARLWRELQRDNDVDAERDLLAPLGRRVVLHNHPPHPLRIPLCCTMLIEIARDGARVREAFDTIGRCWQQSLAQADEKRGTPGLMSVHRDDDGVWYVQFGFVAGIAWTVTDRNVVTSWSPAALRAYLSAAGAAAGAR